MKKKASIIIVSLTFISLIVCVTCRATTNTTKCAKPTLVYDEKDSTVLIKPTDDSDSVHYSFVLSDDPNVVLSLRELCSRVDNPDSTWYHTLKSRSIYECESYVYSDGKESSDTLYYWQILSSGISDRYPIFVYYEDGKIKLICSKEYGEKVSFYTTDDKLLGEVDMNIPNIEYPIPVENKYVKIAIQRNEYSHYIVTYPLH